MKKGIMDARTLAYYIKTKYFDKYECEISKIKLQKALYFLFAYWGSLIRKSSQNPEFVEEDLSKKDEYLFQNVIEAWVYGPVVPDVYRKIDEERYTDYSVITSDIFLKETIDSILEDLFSIADFKLVSISHEDLCWQRSFNPEDQKHCTEIDKDRIIEEYAKRECI